MGFTDLSYHAYHAVAWPKCIDMGDRLEPNNPFAWDRMVLNLPGAEEYD